MLKAAFVTPGAYPVPSSMGGSVERVVEKVVPILSHAVDTRIYGRVAKRLPAIDRLSGVVRIERLPAADKRRYIRLVRDRLVKFNPDVIQIENRPQWVPYLKKTFPNARVWLNLHSTTFVNPPYMNVSSRARYLGAADTIQVNSEFLKSYIGNIVPGSAGKIKVNPLGVDVARFTGKSSPEGMRISAEWRRKKGWGRRPIVLYVGRLVPQKGIHYLLDAVPALVAQVPDVLVVIVGSARYGSHRPTPYSRRLRRQAARWSKHVHFQPYVPHDQIPHWFVMADVAVVPSVGQEAFGLVNLEAMAAELPVVATKAGGMKEIVVDRMTGYLVANEKTKLAAELAAHVGFLLGNEALRKDMGRNGRERVLAEFQWKHTAERWLKFQNERK
ncbi:glycosyltransferase family 4 protein [Cohnella soli]|uniref:Glycosyltransferase family 4 protein n=1 Tax=Cohnella soli TaxID=425005 RepID=A0ABW0HZ08_9BACL